MEKIDLTKLDTEKRNAHTANIDQLSTIDMIYAINKEDETVTYAVKKVAKEIAAAVDLIYGQLKQGGRLFYVGAGNSGRLGLLDACECPPTFGVREDLVIGILAGGNQAAVHSKEGAEDSEQDSVDMLKLYGLTAKDAVVGLSASGRTPYVKGALRLAGEVGAKSVSVCCVNKGEISSEADIAIEIITGPEVITGSTRLKAGTAQKMVLNMLSTGSMIRLGKVYGNYMVDVRAHNKKLVERGKKIVMDCTGASREQAEIVLEKTEGKVKLAVMMILSGKDKETSSALLAQNDETIYKALKAINID